MLELRDVLGMECRLLLATPLACRLILIMQAQKREAYSKHATHWDGYKKEKQEALMSHATTIVVSKAYQDICPKGRHLKEGHERRQQGRCAAGVATIRGRGCLALTVLRIAMQLPASELPLDDE